MSKDPRPGFPLSANNVRAGTRIGTTHGLMQPHDDATCSAEQVYVNINPDVPTHPVYIEGWTGYHVASRLRLTKRQTTELIGLLARAVAEL